MKQAARVLVLLGLARVAHAEVEGLQDPAHPIPPPPPPPPSKPDPVVDRSAMHGVESSERHQGLNVTLALGGGLTIPLGSDRSLGRGPLGSLRLAHMAGDHWAFTAELANITLLHRVEGSMQSGTTLTDLGNNFLVGVQIYVNRALWIRGGVGLGGFQPDEPGSMTKKILSGPSGVVGGGFDIVRFRRAAIGVEMMGLGMLNRDGMLATTAILLDLSIE